jgi:hypothetical protein
MSRPFVDVALDGSIALNWMSFKYRFDQIHAVHVRVGFRLLGTQ